MSIKTTKTKRIIVTGYGQHGKGTTCDLFRAIGFDSISSSRKAAELFLFDKMVAEGYDYKSVDECHADRMNHRQYWYEAIRDFNAGDETRLARAIFEDYPIYDGIRSIEELTAIREAGLIDAVVWVDASQRLGPESSDSMTVGPQHAEFILNNNYSLVEGRLPEDVANLAIALLQ